MIKQIAQIVVCLAFVMPLAAEGNPNNFQNDFDGQKQVSTVVSREIYQENGKCQPCCKP